MEDRLLEAKEVSRLLGISRRRAWLLGRRGVLPVVRLGARQVRYSSAALREWVARGGASAAAREAVQWTPITDEV
jgi:predicted DNA-binding transcriptional regulator AlpA